MSFPILYDAASKKILLGNDALISENRPLQFEIDQLNSLIKDYINTNAEVPPVPSKENFTKNLSMMVKKMHESSVLLMRQKKFTEASKQFTIALGLALARSKFESFQLTLPEIIICLLGRCDAYTQSKDYLNAYLDSEILCQLAANVPDNHLRKGVCNLNLGNLLGAKTDFERGLCFNNKHPILLKMLHTVNEFIDYENGDL